ncbi:nucleotide sugar dehydrogenase, partial [Vagococcus sp. BWB3-3]
MTHLHLTTPANLLREKIATKEAKIGVIGLGYVGLPHALHYGQKGFSVLGIDINQERIAQLLSGDSYIDDVADQDVATYLANNQVATTFELLPALDVIFIDVPTPIDAQQQPDLTALKSAASQVIAHVRQGQLIILESTSYPTTTLEHLVTPLLEKGLTPGKDIFIAFSPERVDPGNQQFNFDNTPKLVGGVTETCTSLAMAVIGDMAVAVSSPEVAEMAKLYENTFRFVNIALADELSKLCHQLNIAIDEVLTAAATKPFGFMRFDPAVKIGGHCIGVDPFYLQWYMAQQQLSTPLINTAAKIDASMLDFLMVKLLTALTEEGLSISGARIGVLGVTYKKNISDTRMSAAPELVNILLNHGSKVSLFDSHVSSLSVKGQQLPVSP